ncbi:MAG TPA: hypothetical protein PLO00_05630 [Usitatibacteraceae bacterium]|nr:hypothetical protein [Usitatibacteraceae bacterium]
MRHIPGRVPLAAVPIKSTIALVAFLQAVSPLGIAKVSPAADARHCLDLGDNREIARCAEQYRPGGPRRHARMADSAPPPAPAAAPAPTAAPAPAVAPAPASPAPVPKRKRRVKEVDARHCLDLATIAAITRCAQKYR